MSKKFFFRILLIILILCLPLYASAHPGRTDGNGGHTNHSTGEYHYHHGHPAHNHCDMDNDGKLDCPYLFDNKTSNNSGNSNGSASGQNSKNDTKNSVTLGEKILGVSILAGIIRLVAYELFHKK